jgi:NAD(P)-dependent dehydrogenase (short-subunit alcohol dehydrogenase family)
MSVVITGWNSRISEEFRKLLAPNEKPGRASAVEGDFPFNGTRYLFCQGLLRPKREEDQTPEEIQEAMMVNYISIRNACEILFERNPVARVCIIGSESAYRGSFDGTYSKSKLLIHEYVERKRLNEPAQQLVAISPSIIEDAGMTTRRDDLENLRVRRMAHPKGRFIWSAEVACLAHHLLYHQSYITGTVIRMNGGLN